VGTLAAVASLQADVSARADAGYRPFMAIAALLLLMAIARVSFGPRRRGAKLPPGSRTVADLGLLVAVSKTSTRSDADALRDRLREHDVRASVSAEHDGFVVLVFLADQVKARDLLQSH
jgi:hypothetical protein